MEKTKQIAAVLSVSLLTINVACAVEEDEGRWFVAGKYGIATVADSYDEVNYHQTKWEFSHNRNYAVSLGCAMASFSLEAEYSYRRFDAERRICPSCYTIESRVANLYGYQTQRSLLVMGTWFPIQNSVMKPFLGLGAGYTKISWAKVRVEGIESEFVGDDTVFTYKLRAGVEFPMSDSLAATVAYNYLKPDHMEVNAGGGEIGKLNKQEINILDLGIKYRF